MVDKPQMPKLKVATFTYTERSNRQHKDFFQVCLRSLILSYNPKFLMTGRKHKPVLIQT